MFNRKLVTVCGLYCGNCQYLDGQCKGCVSQKGKPFWTAQANMEVCPLYNCCLDGRGLEHCGLCPEFPCQKFLSLRDPSLSEEEAGKSLAERQHMLKERKELGTKKWLEQNV